MMEETYKNITWFPNDYAPLVVWVVFLGYVFFPSNKIFNPEGRNYFYKLGYICLFTAVYQMEFRIAFTTDQLVSFVGPLRDLEYTVCYYTSDFNNPHDVAKCKQLTFFSFYFLLLL